MKKLKIGLVCLRADNFDGGLEKNFHASVEALSVMAKELDYDFVHYPELVLTEEDARTAAAMLMEQKLDFLMMQLTAFPSGNAVIRLAKSCPRIGVWGIPESSYEGSNFVNSNNSFCGMNMSGSIIAQYLKDLNIEYKWFFGYASDPRFCKRFSVTVWALDAIQKTASSRVALVGGIAPGFNDLYFDERLGLSKLGVEIQRGHEFSEIYARAHAYKEGDMKEWAENYACRQCGNDVNPEDIAISARYWRAYKDFAAENRYDALAVGCWPQIKVDALACSVIGKLNQDGIPASCEGDVPGAISMMMLRYITGHPATLMDLCAIDEQDETALMWHCGPSPECYADCRGATTTRSYQLNLAGEVNSSALIHDLVFKPQPVTFMRIAGEWDSMFLLDGQCLDRSKTSPDGSRGWIGSLRLNRQPIKTIDLVNTIMTHGFQHHYPMMAGDITDVCMEVAAWLNLKPLHTVPYEDYKQRP